MLALTATILTLQGPAFRLHNIGMSFVVPLKCNSTCYRRRYVIGVFAAFQVFFIIVIVTSTYSSKRSDISTTERCGCHDTDRSHMSSPDESSGRRSNRSTLFEELNMTSIELMSLLNDDDCAKTFLEQYEQFCETALLPADINNQSLSVNETVEREDQLTHRQLCPCVPRHLRCPCNPLALINEHAYAITESGIQNYGVDHGGHWSPKECVARQRIAIIIPFRDREAHLDIFLRVLHPMLQRQLVDYTIFVVEQFQPTNVFNKASVMNAGFLEVRALEADSSKAGSIGGPFDCYLFHDVDMLPEDDRNFYGCGARLPRHVGAYVSKFNYRLFYYRMFGGAMAFRPDVFELVNGFSNEFYGWGGEDDDMFNRIQAKNLSFIRFPKCVAKYSMISHGRDKTNKAYTNAAVGWKMRADAYKRDGLNSIHYKLMSTELRPLYTWLLVSLPPPPID